MRRYDPNQPLISLHVPKCAGSSLRRILRGWFRDRLFLHYYDEVKGQMPVRHVPRAGFWRRILLRKKYPPRVCIHGHFNCQRGFGVNHYYPDASQFITILRDPFEIAVSGYFYNKRRGPNRYLQGQPAPISSQYQDFKTYFEQTVLQRNNFVVNYLPPGLTLQNFARVFDTQFVYLGIAEDMEFTLRQLARRLGFPPVTIMHTNASPRDEVVEPGMREAFIGHHRLEYALYEYALEHYKD